jgi:hypothetical protein
MGGGIGGGGVACGEAVAEGGGGVGPPGKFKLGVASWAGAGGWCNSTTGCAPTAAVGLRSGLKGAEA